MKILLLAVMLTFLFGACGCLPRPAGEREGAGRIRLMGRWDASGAPTRIVAVNPGSSFEFRYQGTKAVLHFDRSGNKPPLPQLWVQLDGEWSKQVVDRDEIAIGEGAKPGRHQAWVVVKALDEHQARWKPPLVSALVFAGVEVPDGKLLSPPRARKHLLEAIGDSITEGVLAVRPGKLEEWTEIADARATWAFRTAEVLGAEPRIIGFGAQGVTKGGNGGVPPAGLAYPFVCDGVPAKDRPADIVVINQGCNDGGVPNIENGYRNLIKLARGRNPEAAIFCLVPFAQVHERSVRFAVEGTHNEGDAKVFLVETQGWIDPKADTTDGVHPNEAGHEKAATKLTEFIRKTLRK